MTNEQPEDPQTHNHNHDLEEKHRKAQEDAEQSQLPYKWTQTIRDVDVTIPVAANIRGKDLEVSLKNKEIRVAIKGQEAFVEVCFCLPTTHLRACLPVCVQSRSSTDTASRLELELVLNE